MQLGELDALARDKSERWLRSWLEALQFRVLTQRLVIKHDCLPKGFIAEVRI